MPLLQGKGSQLAVTLYEILSNIIAVTFLKSLTLLICNADVRDPVIIGQRVYIVSDT